MIAEINEEYRKPKIELVNSIIRWGESFKKLKLGLER